MSAEPQASEPAPRAPIPGLRAMAIVRWALLALVVALAAGTWWAFVIRDETVGAREDRYHCPMHPQIRSPEPGTCPICFMSLEPIPADGGRDEGHGDHGDALAVRADETGARALADVMLTTERRQRAGIRTAAARRESARETTRWPAVVEAREGARAEVRVRTAAYVERVAVREPGVDVRAGQVLAWVYAPEILRAEEELLTAHRWADGARGEGAARGSALEQAERAARERLRLLGVADAEIDRVIASGRAERRVALRAPIAGYLARAEAAVGAYARPEDVLYEIVDLSRVRVVASAFGDELDALDRGSEGGRTARFVPRGGGEPVPLALELVEPAVDSATRSARVRFLAASGDDLALRPGAIGDVVIDGGGRDALLVPRDAVIDTGLRRYVFVEREPGTFEAREVELGALVREGSAESREIVRGLEAGEVVVSRGAFVLDSESRLEAALAPHPRPPRASHSDDPAERTSPSTDEAGR